MAEKINKCFGGKHRFTEGKANFFKMKLCRHKAGIIGNKYMTLIIINNE